MDHKFSKGQILIELILVTAFLLSFAYAASSMIIQNTKTHQKNYKSLKRQTDATKTSRNY